MKNYDEITRLSWKLILNQVDINFYQKYVKANKQATGMTKISRGGNFENFSARGVFYRKFRILTGSRVFSLIKP